MSGVGPARTRAGQDFGAERPPGRIPFQSTVPRGPGATVTFPDDPIVGPFLLGEESGAKPDPNAPARITGRMLDEANAIDTPYDRARSLLDMGREAILGSQLALAHRALELAGHAAIAEPDSLRHDQMIIEQIVRTSAFTDAIFIEGRNRASLVEDEMAAQPLPARKLNPQLAVRLVRLEWQRAAVLARQIINPTFRSEYLERVAEAISRDSHRIIEYIHPPATSEIEGEPRPPSLTGDQVKGLEASADQFLVDAIAIAEEIERPIWKSFALERIAVNAGQSQQFDRAFKVAASIQNAERRAQTLILVAEEQCQYRRHDEATRSYAAAAEAVACIEQAGLRGVVNGFLVDSLISQARFEDARACLSLYPDPSDRLVALEAVAEGQGSRGDPAAAREWILREVPPQYRSALLRRVNNGVMSAIAKNRANMYLEGSPASDIYQPVR